VAAWVGDMFCKCYLVKNHKIANNTANAEAGGKVKHSLGINRILVKC
jgi:hypothetical protein